MQGEMDEMNKLAIWLTLGILLPYYVFTSGFFYWASGSEETKQFIMPFNYALSAEDTGLVAIATKSDMDCVNWLANDSDQSLKIACGSNAMFLLSGHTELLFEDLRTWYPSRDEHRLIAIWLLANTDRCYIFLTEWNTEHEQYVFCTDVGLRGQKACSVKDGILTYDAFYPDGVRTYEATTVVKEVYRSGGAIVYTKGF